MKMHKLKFSAIILLQLGLLACTSGGNVDDDQADIDGSGIEGNDLDTGSLVNANFSIVYVDRSVESAGNPTDGIRFKPGGDLYLKSLASPNAEAVNITDVYTEGLGDVSDPEVSFDGRTVVFSMRGPADTTWNLWEYDSEAATIRRLIGNTSLANEGDDVDPAYLPDGRIVFSSNRQEKTKRLLAAENKEPYTYLDEYERERSLALHVLNRAGNQVEQISFNQSHDRNPTVLSSGAIMYARWDHVGNRNHFPLFFTNPDGTNMFVLYGAFSPGNSFLHPKEMPDGKVISSLMPLSGTGEGGALVLIDIDNFSEFDQPAPGFSGTEDGQVGVTLEEIPIDDEPSEFGRYTTPNPLWDGTNRVLVSWTAAQESEDDDPIMGEDGPPRYGIHMLNLDDQSLRPIQLAAPGRILTDPTPLFPRAAPNIVAEKPVDASLAAMGRGILNVKSIYDTDDLDIMGDRVLVADEFIPTIDGVADLLSLKQARASDRPGRFVRVTRAVPTPPGVTTDNIGSNDMEMQELLGYSIIAPDGSLRIEVPADTPLGLTVVDANGRALQTHTNWLQVRPGETRTCNGCHSPRRGSAINAAPIAGDHSNTRLAASVEPGESMAETKTRLDPSALSLTADIEFEDIWTLEEAGPDLPFSITYNDLTTSAPSNGVINYPEHIQPLWDLHNCAACHNGADGGLDLSATTAATGRLTSYEQLTLGEPVLGPSGLPITFEEDGEVLVQREPALVEMGSAINSSRTSHLIEKLYETELLADRSLAPTTIDHANILNVSELRLLQEWIDVGAQYFNSPYESSAGADGFYALDEIRSFPAGLDEGVFAETVQPLLLQRCGACHGAVGPDGDTNSGFSAKRFVLTGALEGDFNITRAMVSNICDAESSLLLTMPSIIQQGNVVHPAINGQPVLQSIENDFQTILTWIEAAADSNNCS